MKEKQGVYYAVEKFYKNVNKNIFVLSIRESLISIIPIIIIGAIALVLRSLPISMYQDFISNVFDGAVYNLIGYIYQATYGMVSLYMTISLSSIYSSYKTIKGNSGGAIISALAAFGIFCGVTTPDTFRVEYFGPNGMFEAIICSICAISLYSIVYEKMNYSVHLYANGMDGGFRNVVKSIMPIFIVIATFSLVNLGTVLISDADCFQTWFMQTIAKPFQNMGRSFGSLLLYLLVSQILWFFGIHGSDILLSSKDTVFNVVTGLDTDIISGTFLDVFVLMGGCGATWALLIAVLLCSKRRSNRSLSKIAALPMLFNINEMIVFGLPVVCNLVFAIPFIVTPIVIMCISYFAMASGLVPVVITEIEWTTPVFLNGYLATGSIAGVLLQAFNLVVGILIYLPFVKFYDAIAENTTKEKMDGLVEELKKSEESKEPIELLALRNDYGNVAENLADELELWIKSKGIVLYYQPQYNHNNELIGAEALLRWNHPVYGMIYPPLVIKLAEETGNLVRLEKEIFYKVAEDLQQMMPVFDKLQHISVNVTGTTIQGEEFEEFLGKLRKEYPDVCEHILIEITEQAALRIDNPFIEKLDRLRELGYVFGIDDFSMGSTSIKYLQSNAFSLVKLDGAISKDILDNVRSKEIISSIAKLTQELGIDVLAEYVETEQQRQALEDVGCYLYQGYLYSPAVTLDKFMEVCK